MPDKSLTPSERHERYYRAFQESRTRWDAADSTRPIDRHDAIIEPLDRLIWCVASGRDCDDGSDDWRSLRTETWRLIESYFHLFRELARECLPESMLPTACGQIDCVEDAIREIFVTPMSWDEKATEAKRLLWDIARRWPPLFRNQPVRVPAVQPRPPEVRESEGGTPRRSAKRPARDPNQPGEDRRNDILATITGAGVPLTRPELIEAMKLKKEGKLGHQLAWMVANNILVNIPHRGYWLADRPVPK